MSTNSKSFDDKELLEKAGLKHPDNIKSERSKLRFKIVLARDYSNIILENIQQEKDVRVVKNMRIEELISIEDSSYAAYVEIHPTYKPNSKSIILGNWKNGLTVDEISYLQSKYNLPNFEEDEETEVIPSWKITNDFSLDLTVLAEQAIANVLLQNSLISDSEENMNLDKESKAYYYFEEDTKVTKNKKVESAKRAFKKYTDFSSNANEQEKALLAELLTYQNSEIVVESHTEEEYLEFFDSLILPENQRLLLKMSELIDKVSQDGAFEVLKKHVYFHRLLNTGDIFENLDTGMYFLKLTELKSEELGTGYTAALTRWKAIGSQRTAQYDKAAENLPKSQSKFHFIDKPKTNRKSLSEMISEEPIELPKTFSAYNEKTDLEESVVVDAAAINLLTATEEECDEWAKKYLKDKNLDAYLTKVSLTQKKTVLKKFLNN